MNERIIEQILSIRASGVTNMFDLPHVQREAYDRGFHELVLYLKDHRAKYSRFILTGEAEDSE
ncbi:MAG: DUF5049 domain-containing protein [Peptococcaceae bacterium]|nr:DUF5049 domain-containing protein [Peptococcaceae bacterium]